MAWCDCDLLPHEACLIRVQPSDLAPTSSNTLFLQELEAEAQKLQVEIPAIGTKSERLTAELAKQEQVTHQAAHDC